MRLLFTEERHLSQAQAAAFLDSVAATPTRQEKFQGIRTAAAAVALGAEKGYSFSVKNFNAAGDKFNEKVVGARGELNDD